MKSTKQIFEGRVDIMYSGEHTARMGRGGCETCICVKVLGVTDRRDWTLRGLPYLSRMQGSSDTQV